MVNHLASKGGIFMRLIHCFLTKDEFSNKLNKARSFLTSASIPLSISDRGIYHNSRGTEISNFFIFPLSVSFKYNTNGHKMADVYQFELLNHSQCVRLTISSGEIGNYKWLKTISGCFYLRKPSENYRHLLGILDAMLDFCQSNTPFWAKTGFHHLGNQWCYAASNLTIYSEQLDWGQHMLHEDCSTCASDCSQCPYRLNSSFEGTEVPATERIQNTIIPIMAELQKNIKVALPIFIINLLSGISSVFSSAGLCTPLTLWITGKPGSGKTQMALYLGSFYHKPSMRNDAMLAKNFLRANINTKSIKKCIQNRRDNTVILDDVKLENSTSLGEHKNTNLDTLIRSIFDHNLEGISVYCNAIITGEYQPNVASTLARIILLPLRAFQETPENLATLSFFQDNGYLLSDFMILFLQWICQQLEKKSFIPTLQAKKQHYTENYMQKDFSPRNSEILTTLRFGLDLLEELCFSYLPPSYRETIGSIIADGKNCFEHLVRNTAYLHEGKTALHAELLCNMVLGDGTIGKAAEVRYHGKLNYFNYCISSEETGMFIEKTSVLSIEPYFQKPEHCHPCLLLREDMLKEFPYKLEEYCINHGIPSSVYKSFQFSDLADTGFILVAYNRSDGHANHLLQYPSINIDSSHTAEISLDSFTV